MQETTLSCVRWAETRGGSILTMIHNIQDESTTFHEDTQREAERLLVEKHFDLMPIDLGIPHLLSLQKETPPALPTGGEDSASSDEG
jgi:hypothetical protein